MRPLAALMGLGMDAFERAQLAQNWPSSRQELIRVLTAFYERFGREPSRKKLKRLRPGPHVMQLVWFGPSGTYVNYTGPGLPDVRGSVQRYAEDRAGDRRGRSGFRIGRRNKLLEAPPIP